MYKAGKPWDVYITPHGISLLVLVDNWVTWDGLEETRSRLGFYIADSINHVDGVIEKDLQTLLQELGSLPHGQVIVDTLVYTLDQFQSLDHIQDFFNEIAERVEEPDELGMDYTPRIERASTLGIFLRKMIWAFQKMNFDGLARLWDEIQQYRKGAFRGIPSPAVADRFVENQVMAFPKEMIGRYSRAEMEQIIETIKSVAPGLSRTHYLTFAAQSLVSSDEQRLTPLLIHHSFLNALAHADFGLAVDSMHQYFDYSILGQLEEQLIAAEGAKITPVSYLPYATLHLAALHFRFGHVGETLELVHEAARQAQEMVDERCITEVLMSLQRVASVKNDHMQQLQLLKQCLARSLEMLLPEVAVQSMLSLSTHHALRARASHSLLSTNESGPSTSPTQVWRYIKNAIKATLQSNSITFDQMYSNASSHTASMFDMWGEKIASEGHALSAISAGAPNDMNLASIAQLARSLANKGQFKKALSTLISAKLNIPGSPAYSTWERVVREVTLARAIATSNFKQAELQAVQIQALSNKQTDIFGWFAGRSRSIDVNIATGNYRDAARLAVQYGIDAQSLGSPIHLMYHQGCIMESLLASNDYVGAVPYALSVIALARQYHVHQYELSAKVALAYFELNAMHSPERCRRILLELLPLAGKHEHIGYNIRIRTLLAQASLALAQGARDLEAVLVILADLLKLVKSSQFVDAAIEVYYMQARIYHELGRESERDEAAGKILRLQSKEHLQRQSGNNGVPEAHPTLYDTTIDAISEELKAVAETVI